jgi:hypothetical protein
VASALAQLVRVIEPRHSEQMASNESGRCPTPRRAGPRRRPVEVVEVTSAASGGGPFSPEDLLADPRWRCRVFEDHSHARGRRGWRTMECTRAFDLPSESRFARHSLGTGQAVGVVSPHTRRPCATPVVPGPESRVLESPHIVKSELAVPDAANESHDCAAPAVREPGPATARARHPGISRS